MLSIRGRDGSLQGAGRSAWSAKEEDISWFAHLLEICLFVPVAGLAGTAGSGVIPYVIDQQAGREFAIQAICLAQFRLNSRDFGSSLVKLPLQIRLGRGEPASRDMGPSSQYSHSGRTSRKFSRIVGRCSQMFFWLFSVSHRLNFWG